MSIRAEKGSFSLEYVLFIGAALALTVAVLPGLLAHLSGYFDGFHD